MWIWKTVSIVLMSAAAAAGCQKPPLAPDQLTSVDALVAALRQQGATVQRMETLPASSYPFFSVPAQRLKVNDADVQAFQFASTAAADANAARISATGTPIGGTQITWIDTPHFYKRDRIIALYVGRTAEVMGILERVLGKAVAGGRE